MTTEAITIHVDAAAAHAFHAASPEERRKLEALLSLHLIEATRTPEPLAEVMREISRNAQERGLTTEILEAILDDE